MSNVRIYDKAMCCSTGVCGPEVDPVLARFAADLDWLKVQGHSVVRFNLSQDPAEYAAQEQVKQMLADEGVECLPLVFVDDRVVSRSEYPSRENLALWTETPLSPPANTSIGPPANTSTGPPAGTVAGPRHGLPVADCGGGGETGCC